MGGTEKGDFLYEIFAVFSLLKILAIISNKIEKYKAFKLLDETSYGVYIFHMIFLYVFYCIFKNVIGEQYMIDNEVVLNLSWLFLQCRFLLLQHCYCSKLKY